MAFQPTELTHSYDLSRNGSLNIGGELLEGFKSGSISLSADSIDNSTRDDGDWGRNTPSKRTASLSVTCNKKNGTAPCQDGLRSLWLSSTFGTSGVEVIYRSENGATSAGTGFSGTFILTNYTETQQYAGEAVEIQLEFSSWGPITADT